MPAGILQSVLAIFSAQGQYALTGPVGMAYIFGGCQDFLHSFPGVGSDGFSLFQIESGIPSLTMKIFQVILRHVCFFRGTSTGEGSPVQGYSCVVQINLNRLRIPKDSNLLPDIGIRHTVKMTLFQPADSHMIITCEFYLLTVTEAEGNLWKLP